jgi:hypothetical protein
MLRFEFKAAIASRYKPKYLKKKNNNKKSEKIQVIIYMLCMVND